MAGDIARRLEEICRSYGVADLYVFGSRAGEVEDLVSGGRVSLEPSGSDVDIGVLPAERAEWGPERRVRLSMELEDLFQVDRVDLVLLPQAEPYLALDVIRGGLLYTEDADRQARYELYVLRRAGDLMPFKKERMRSLHAEGVLTQDQAELFRMIAGYRNRMVHFYHEVTDKELYRLSTGNLGDLELLLEALVGWLRAHPEKLDRRI